MNRAASLCFLLPLQGSLWHFSRAAASNRHGDGGRSLIVCVYPSVALKRAVPVSEDPIVIWKVGRLYVVFPMRREVEIVKKLGLYARPAAEFVRCVIGSRAQSRFTKARRVFRPPALEVLSADLDCAARLILDAIGSDEQEVVDSLELLLLRFRDEEDGAQGNRGSPGPVGAIKR
jgi:phosphotransferase system HPr-like phosphotransfer protein